MLRTIAFLLMLLPAIRSEAQELSIRFNLDQARQAIALLQQTSHPTEAQLTAFAALPGNRALAQKVHGRQDTAGAALAHAWEGKTATAGERPFRFTGIRKYRDTLAGFLAALERQTGAITDSVSRALRPYAVAGKKKAFTVYVLFGGPSMAFTLGDDSAFYVGLQFYNFDLNALRESCKHELLHNLQAAHYDGDSVAERMEKTDTGAARAYALVQHLFREGSAEWLADLPRAPQTPKIRELTEHAAVNDNRTEAVFYLFERTLLDISRKPAGADYDRAYELLFDWNWNNPGYYLGYRMMKSLEADQGQGVLRRYIGKDPTVFLLDYIALTKKRPELCAGKFSAEFESLALRLAALAANRQ